MDTAESEATVEPPSRAGEPLSHPSGLFVQVRGEISPRDARWLAEQAQRALAPLELQGQVCVRVVGDREMDEAHRRWSGVPGATDVLTFDMRDDPAAPLETDLLVCIDEARRQGEARGHTPARELLLYIVHGVLHCLGHDDAEEHHARAMHALEDELLTRAGVGPIYAAPPRAPEDAT